MKKHREKKEKEKKETWLRWAGDGVSTEAAMRESEKVREREMYV